MYKSFTADEFRKMCNLPPDYEVAGFICYGAWDDEKHFKNFEDALKDIGIEYKINTLEYKFLQPIREIEIKGRKYWFAIEYGGATLSEYLHLACLFGSKKNIHIGSCGGLNPNLNFLDLILQKLPGNTKPLINIILISIHCVVMFPDFLLAATL